MCVCVWYCDSLKLPFHPFWNPHQSICAPPWAGWLPGLFWRKYQMTCLPAANPGHQGGLLSQYPFFGLFSSTSCFQVQGKVKALRMCSPDFTTRHAGGAVLFSRTRLCSIYFFPTSSCSHIHFISSSFYCNQYSSKVIFFMQLFIKCFFISVTGAPVQLE